MNKQNRLKQWLLRVEMEDPACVALPGSQTTSVMGQAVVHLHLLLFWGRVAAGDPHGWHLPLQQSLTSTTGHSNPGSTMSKPETPADALQDCAGC